ncbi:MAG: hypothetical protein HQL23_05010 [Candidatus Omnitrophica bacterium]|nr:hypothetical protein [Candidatus Omnitrophota bacterium]
MTDRLLNLSLSVSFVLHLLLVGGLCFVKGQIPKLRNKAQIEVVYHMTKPLPKEPPVKKAMEVFRVQPAPRQLPKDIKIISRDYAMRPKLDGPVKDMAKIGAAMPWKDQMALKGQGTRERKVVIPFLKSEKIYNPHYQGYTEAIRNNIGMRANHYVDHVDYQEGEVYLTFLLAADGKLLAVKIIEEKTRANAYLRDVAVRSVREAAPFAAFPKDMNYPELSFNLIISFRAP